MAGVMVPCGPLVAKIASMITGGPRYQAGKRTNIFETSAWEPRINRPAVWQTLLRPVSVQ